MSDFDGLLRWPLVASSGSQKGLAVGLVFKATKWRGVVGNIGQCGDGRLLAGAVDGGRA